VPGTDLAPIWAPYLLASGMASHQVPGTDWGTLFASIQPGVAPGAWHRLGPCLLACGLASHRVPGTDFGPLFASIRTGAAPGAWHRFGTDLGPLFASIRHGVAPGAWHRFGRSTRAADRADSEIEGHLAAAR
jgi:hypothetical protein